MKPTASQSPTVREITAESYPFVELIQFWQYSLRARDPSEKKISRDVEAAQQLAEWLEGEGYPTEPNEIAT